MSEDGADVHAAMRLIGGEMTDWQDAVPQAGPLATVLGSQAVGRVLLAGPFASSLATAPEFAGKDLTVLVRGTRDAARIAAMGITVLCGSLAFLPTATTFDTIIVLDPPSRLLSPDTSGLGVAAMLERLENHLAPTGQLVALIQNRFAADKASDLRQGTDCDADWWRGHPGFSTESLAINEVPGSITHVVLGAATGPTAVLARERLNDPSLPLLVGAATAPASLATAAVKAGLGLSVAGDWLTSLGPRSTPPDSVVIGLRGLVRDPHTTATGDAFGALLGAQLQGGNLPEVRRLCAEYADWVEGLADTAKSSAVPRNAAYEPRQMALIETPTASQPATTSAALGRGLLDFARSIVTGAGAHPFTPALDATGVAHELAAICGWKIDWDGAVELERRDPLSRPPQGRASPATDERGDLLRTIATRDSQVAALRVEAQQMQRRVRALEHAIATEQGPRARRALFVLTAPTARLAEAARAAVLRRRVR